MIKQLLFLIVFLLFYSNGKAQWSANSAINNQLSISTDNQVVPKIIPDGLGGYIIAWTEQLANDYNVYAQKVDSAGVRLWGTKGIEVCNKANNQVFSSMVSDGAGGAIIVWEDSTGTGGGGIYGENDVYAQRLDANGAKLWDTNGVIITAAVDIQSYVNVVTDGARGAIVTWHDFRNSGYLGSDVYAQRVDSLGNVLWITNGKLVCNANQPQVRPRACSDNNGGVIIAWEDYRFTSQSEIYIQRINSSGNAVWTNNGVYACQATFDQRFPEVIADGSGGAFVTWLDKRTQGNTGFDDLYGQRVNASGVSQWGVSGVLICNAPDQQFGSYLNLSCMTLDGGGGFFYVWNDTRNGGNHDIYIQRVSATGTSLWTPNGVAVISSTNFNELYPSIAPDGNGGVFVTWDRFDQTSSQIYGQRMNASGIKQWDPNGLPIANALSSKYNNQLIANANGTAICVFQDKRNGNNFNIFGQRVIQNGTCLPPIASITASTTTVCNGSSSTLTVSGAQTYVWSNSGLGTGATKTVSPTVNTIYTVVASADGCSSTTTIELTVIPIPTVNISTTVNPVCIGSSTTLIASGAVYYLWNNSTTNDSLTVSPTAATIYTVTGTAANGCISTATKTITTLVKPGLAITPSVATVCTGNSTTITALGAATYVWNTAATTASVLVSPSSTTAYTVTGTAANGCSNTATRIVNVNVLPVLTVNPANASTCGAGNVTLTVSGANAYLWSNGLGGGNSKTVNQMVTTTYTITGTSATGCSSSITKTVFVHPIPVATITPNNSTLCAGQSTTMIAAGGNTYSWNTGSTDSTLVATPASNTGYTVTATSAEGCTATSVSNIIVNSSPSVTITASKNIICIGESINITADGAVSYVWDNSTTSPTQLVSPTVSTTYTVTGTGGNGCSSTATIYLQVTPTLVVSISSFTPLTLCSGQSSNLLASGANTYSWSNGATGISQSVSPSVTTSYTVTGTSSDGCIGTSSVELVVNPKPIVSISPSTNISICSGQSTSLTALGTDSYSWNSGQNMASISVTPTTTTTYTVTASNTFGCTATDSKTVHVTTSALVSISSTSSAICAGNSTTLTASGADSYSWSNMDTSASTTVNPTSTTTYTVTGTTAVGCTGTSSVELVVNPNPVVGASSALNPICEGNSTTLTASGADTYLWSNTETTANTVVNPVSTTTYTVTGTSSDGCIGTSLVELVVNPNPVVGTSSALNPICEGNSTTLTASGADSYSWSNMDTSASTTVNPTSTTTYTVTGTTAAGCTGTSSIELVVNPNPVVSASSTVNAICQGNSTTLTAAGADSYSWSNLDNTASIAVNPATTTTYTVTGTTAAGCSSTSTIQVIVNSLPVVTISASDTSICTNDTVILTANGALNYVWNNASVNNTLIDNPAVTTTYSVVGTDMNGCINSATKLVDVNPCGNNTVTVKVFIEGYYIGNSQMQPTLLNQGVGNDPLACDSITVELRESISPHAVAYTTQIPISIQGQANFTPPTNVLTGSYYVVIKQRSAVEIWSALPLQIGSNTLYDFTNAATQTYVSNVKEVEPGVFAMYSGDINQDGTVDAFDYLELDPLLILGSFGYFNADLNGDGGVDAFDYVILDPHLVSGVSVLAP